MKKTLLSVAIAATSFSATQAETFLANHPADQIHINDNAFYNPAFLYTTENQLTLTDQSQGQIGWVTEGFGQKLGVHLGQDADQFISGDFDTINEVDGATVDSSNLTAFTQLDDSLDLFWASTLGFGDLGVNLTVAANTNKDLVASDKASTHDNTVTYFFNGEDDVSLESGTNVYEFELDGNESKQTARYIGLDVGAKLNALPATVNLNFGLPKTTSSYDYSWTDTEVVDAAAGGTATARNTDTIKDITSSEVSGLRFDLSGTFDLTQSLMLRGGVMLNTQTAATSDESIVIEQDDTDLNAAGLTTDTEDTDRDSFELKNSLLGASVGARLTAQTGAIEVIVEGDLQVATEKDSSTYEIEQDTFVDELDNNNNTTGRTGVNEEQVDTTLSLNAPIRVSAEWAASEKWTWRAGVSTNLVSFESVQSETTAYKNSDDDATSFEVDYVNQTQDSTTLILPTLVNDFSLGFSYQPIDGVTFAAVFDKNMIENGLTSNGPITNASLSLTVRY
ncbi:hypothetical protein [Reinekea blandensis]|uniref:Thymidylate synthase n=1 Tax=Reinekea blandensis MED297 TaxID=314283 RepID=A4B9D4_9GAMM|nr:hypothetical protein [Reinekea blandensis]EAR11235.1 thymidylate synthase [Reinekea sp. MED297] [Reinekea blandensis MED297]